jgi:hypothetical protein
MKICIYTAECYQPVIFIKKRGTQSDHNKRLPLYIATNTAGWTLNLLI